jgi:hypothetical protein
LQDGHVLIGPLDPALALFGEGDVFDVAVQLECFHEMLPFLDLAKD